MTTHDEVTPPDEEPHMNTRPNRLDGASSPYLRQLADGSVDWWPWCDEALATARQLDRPILLSIGYAACHWCHVMERECFRDEALAALMNERFVCIKVDREERPDVDQLYQAVVQMAAGHGGWPLTVFLLPDGRPFFGGTYYPPVGRQGLPSLPDVLQAVSSAFHDRRAEVERNATAYLEGLSRLDTPTGPAPLSADIVDDACETLADRFDGVSGGFGGAPKFPPATALSLLVAQRRRTGEPLWGDMVAVTLDRMADGGLHDQLGGGFHRYCVDARWRVPHFEKMLHDNALLADAYLQGYALLGHTRYRDVAERTLVFLERELLRPDGLFCSALDAESEGGEGRFYLWTPPEVREVIGREHGPRFCAAFGIKDAGDLEHGYSVPHLPRPVAVTARRLGVSPDALRAELSDCRQALFEAREERQRPARVETAIVSWNALTVRALVRGYRVLGGEPWLERAIGTARGLLDHGVKGADVSRTADATSKQPGVLDDYAHLAAALLDLHETTGDVAWRERAQALTESAFERFWDEPSGGFFLTSEASGLVHRPRSSWDQVVPSGAAVLTDTMLRLSTVLDDARWRARADRTLAAHAEPMRSNPLGYASLLLASVRAVTPPRTVIVVGREGDEARSALLREAWRAGSGLATVLAVTEGDPRTAPDSGDALLAGKDGAGTATAWVCEGASCLAPITGPAELREVLAGPTA